MLAMCGAPAALYRIPQGQPAGLKLRAVPLTGTDGKRALYPQRPVLRMIARRNVEGEKHLEQVGCRVVAAGTQGRPGRPASMLERTDRRLRKLPPRDRRGSKRRDGRSDEITRDSSIGQDHRLPQCRRRPHLNTLPLSTPVAADIAGATTTRADAGGASR